MAKPKSKKDKIDSHDGIESKLSKIAAYTEDETKYTTYSFGFPSLDYCTGKDIKDENGDTLVKVRGLRDGWLLAFTGSSAKGKTALSLQVAGNIVRDIPGARVEYLPNENVTDKYRIMALTGMEEKEIAEKFKLRPTSVVYTEYVEALIEAEAEYKENNKSKMTYKAQTIDGGEAIKYLPTVVIIDSYSQLLRRDIIEDKEMKETFYMKKSLGNKNFLLRVKPLCRKYNIIMMFIVHKKPIINMDMFSGPQKLWKGLSHKEEMKMDSQAEYEADFIMDLGKFTYNNEDKINDKLKTDRFHFGVESTILKNRGGIDNLKLQLAFDRDSGFDPIYSLLLDVYDTHKFITSAGASTKMTGYEGSFYKKDVVNKLHSDLEFRKAFQENIENAYSSILNYSPNIEKSRKANELMKSIF